ncbi:unnamed protein product, partial [Brenthis ino]
MLLRSIRRQLEFFNDLSNLRKPKKTDDDVLLADSGHGGQSHEISQLRRRYYSAQVYAQTQVHSIPITHTLVGRPLDTTGES